jgi:anti-anti-sigma factor
MHNVQTIGTINVVKVAGPLTGDAVKQYRQLLDHCLATQRVHVVLELADTPLIDSEGLEFIADAQQRCLTHGGRVAVAAPQPLCAEILEITGVDACIGVFCDLRSALSDFAK